MRAHTENNPRVAASLCLSVCLSLSYTAEDDCLDNNEHSDPVDPNDPLGLGGIDLEGMAAAAREGGGGVGSNIDVDFSNIDPVGSFRATNTLSQN